MNGGGGDKPRGCLKSYSIMAFVDLQIFTISCVTLWNNSCTGKKHDNKMTFVICEYSLSSSHS